MKYNRIEILAGYTQTRVLTGQCDEVRTCDTVADAKRRAKNLLTDEYQHLCEASEPLRYAQVLADGECIADYFRKGYNGESIHES